MKPTVEEYIAKANIVHNNKYDYSQLLVEGYKGSKCKIPVICHEKDENGVEHGLFYQVAAAHMRGNKCPKCANISRGKRDSQETFINKCKEVHGDKYDYSKVEYVNASSIITIICPEHGEFQQLASAHLNGQGCPKCVGRNRTTEELVGLFKNKHGDKYDYSKVDFKKMNDKVCIICPEHGEFWQTPSKHLQGQGCPECAKETRRKKKNLSTDDFAKRIERVMHEDDDFTGFKYVSMNGKAQFKCKKHGFYYMRPADYLRGHRCPKCGMLISKAEDEICAAILEKDKNVVISRNNRSVLEGKEIDIYFPELRIGIEYNGLRWHSEAMGKGCDYHLSKTKAANKKGVKLIQIFEDEYKYHKEIVLNKVFQLLGLNKGKERIMGRECDIREIAKYDAVTFLDKYHIQGNGKSTVSLGCFYKDKLIAVMTFLKEQDCWNLTRFASDFNYVCQGVGGKLFKYFVRKYNPEMIKTFADRRWTINEDNLYTKIGFVFDCGLDPDYRYVEISNPVNRMHKFNFRKHTLHQRYDLPLDMTESEMVKELGFARIWDCGLFRYTWKKENATLK